MSLVQKAKEVIAKAEAIEQLGMFQQPAAAKALLKEDVAPLLLELAAKVENQGKEITALKTKTTKAAKQGA